MKIIILMCFFALSGCASLQAKFNSMATKGESYVAPDISQEDANIVAQDMAEYLSENFPAAKTTIDVGASKGPLQSTLVEQLTLEGFGVVEKKSDNSILLRYKVSPLYKGVLVRMAYQGIEASRFYSRDSAGGLSAGGYAVKASK